MKAYEGVEDIAPPYLTSELDDGQLYHMGKKPRCREEENLV
jgi:hypothetical protein